MRVGKFSSHINKHCTRCNLQENDIHLFFTCPFAKAAWFLDPWYMNTEILAQHYEPIPAIINAILNSSHPHASITNIMTFLWCIWKARNDSLFGRKTNTPPQVHQAMQAIIRSQDLTSYTEGAGANSKQTQDQAKHGETNRNKNLLSMHIQVLQVTEYTQMLHGKAIGLLQELVFTSSHKNIKKKESLFLQQAYKSVPLYKQKL